MLRLVNTAEAIRVIYGENEASTRPAWRVQSRPVMKLPSASSLAALFLFAALFMTAGCAPPALFENEYGAMAVGIDSGAVIPRGMRRTVRGWEDTSLWYVSPDLESRSIESWIDRQRQLEPNWARRGFEQVRKTPPLMFAVLQITAIAAIVHISRSNQSEQS